MLLGEVPSKNAGVLKEEREEEREEERMCSSLSWLLCSGDSVVNGYKKIATGSATHESNNAWHPYWDV